MQVFTHYKKIIFYGEKVDDSDVPSLKYKFENNDINNNNLFTYSIYVRYQTEYFRIFFEDEHNEYMFYRDYRGEEDAINQITAGIFVTNKKTSSEHDIECMNIEIDDVHKIEEFISIYKERV